MYGDSPATSGEYSLRTDGRGAPLTHEKPTRRRDRAASHWCEAIGSRRFCLKEECGYCGDDEEIDRGEGVATDGGLVCDVSGCEEPAAVRVYPTNGRTNHAALRCWDCLDEDRDSGHFAEWRAAIERKRDFDQTRLETDGGVETDRYEVSGARRIVYGPAFDSEGYVLLVATDDRRVQIEFDEDAMYTLWTEVKGVPWPEPDHMGEKDRLVRQVLHAANGADEESLREALGVLGGERQ